MRHPEIALSRVTLPNATPRNCQPKVSHMRHSPNHRPEVTLIATFAKSPTGSNAHCDNPVITNQSFAYATTCASALSRVTLPNATTCAIANQSFAYATTYLSKPGERLVATCLKTRCLGAFMRMVCHPPSLNLYQPLPPIYRLFAFVPANRYNFAQTNPINVV
jgi:hypothetical protein